MQPQMQPVLPRVGSPFTREDLKGLNLLNARAMVNEFRQRGFALVGFLRTNGKQPTLPMVRAELARVWPKGLAVLVLPVWK